jgi:hypothetical protein
MQALAHDFVLRRNIRIGHAACDDGHLSPPNTFLKLTYGSHHTRLVTGTAALWNTLIRKKHIKATRQIPWPELQVIHSGEAFGITASDHATTFGGLIEIKEEHDDTDGLSGWDFLAQDDSDDLDIDSVLQDLDIDPALVQVPRRHNANADADTAGTSVSNTSVPQHMDDARTGPHSATIVSCIPQTRPLIFSCFFSVACLGPYSG